MGKDTCAEYLKKHLGLSFESSSWFACNHFIYDKLKSEKGYSSIQECYDDRHSSGMRQWWFDLICQYNRDDPAKLGRELFKTHDLYVGLRSRREHQQLIKEIPSLSIWISADKRIKELEDDSSCTVTEEDADFIITNNGSVLEFEQKLGKLVELLR